MDVSRTRFARWGHSGDISRAPAARHQRLQRACGHKAIWLYAHMLAEGADDVRLVLGKYHQSDPISQIAYAKRPSGENVKWRGPAPGFTATSGGVLRARLPFDASKRRIA